jgi:hypothetical protein
MIHGVVMSSDLPRCPGGGVVTAANCLICGEPYVSALHFCAGQEPEARANMMTRTIKLRCHCGRDITWDTPMGTSQLPMCTGCGDFCHLCACSEAPQDAHSGPTAAKTPESALQSPGLSPGAASEAGPLDSEKRCVVCGSQAGVHLATAPVCPEHADPLALERRVGELERTIKAARRSLALLRDSSAEGSWVKCEAEMVLKQIAFHLGEPEHA